jgi:hypothetical protein
MCHHQKLQSKSFQRQRVRWVVIFNVVAASWDGGLKLESAVPKSTRNSPWRYHGSPGDVTHRGQSSAHFSFSHLDAARRIHNNLQIAPATTSQYASHPGPPQNFALPPDGRAKLWLTWLWDMIFKLRERNWAPEKVGYIYRPLPFERVNEGGVMPEIIELVPNLGLMGWMH